ncbi:MAG: PTS lactose/cellobiose transporter subunit IIA [Treponema sp.]|nr:PTS lactose/cellobiose transporter subunit IIA [Treponema sp.]
MDIISECMQMTSFGGEAKSLAMLAIEQARNGDFGQAEESIRKSAESLKKSHQAHTNLLSYEAEEENLQVTLFMVHASDHLTSASVIHLLAEELIYLHKGGKHV